MTTGAVRHVEREPRYYVRAPELVPVLPVPAKRRGGTGQRKNIMDEQVRERLLKEDVWTSDVKANSVFCNGCKRKIKLDSRYRFYLGFWEKHRDRCRGIRRLKGEERPKVLWIGLFGMVLDLRSMSSNRGK